MCFQCTNSMQALPSEFAYDAVTRVVLALFVCENAFFFYQKSILVCIYKQVLQIVYHTVMEFVASICEVGFLPYVLWKG